MNQILSKFLGGFSSGNAGKSGYHRISQSEAKQMMETQNVMILDVREPEEYAQGHIPKAGLLPLSIINAQSAAKAIPDKDATVLVYCRSGSRSKMAAGMLADLGYTGIYEFGGIITWPYGIES